MIITTTPHVEGKRIVRYCGVIAGEAIMGANIFKDIFTIACIKSISRFPYSGIIGVL